MDMVIVNQRLKEIYPAFVIPETSYEVIFINRYMSMEVMDKVLHHINDCYQYSVDTESEKSNNELSIIQVHTIPRTLPSQVLIIELSHLPNRGSNLYVKIKEIFRLIFRSHNEIYSWGDMNLELESANYLFAWPITSELINLQPHFPGWYERARTQCWVQSLEQQAMENNDIIVGQRNLSTSSCTCHRPSPYNEHQLWSLQKAFLYSFNLFIDKTSTLSHWSYGLTSIGSSLTYAQRTKMINYAKYDVMAVTYLIRPITEQWSFTRTKESNIEEMFITFQSTRPPPLRQLKSKNKKNKKSKNINIQQFAALFSCNDPEAEEIPSGDEIYLNQLIEPNDYRDEQNNNNNNKINLLQDQIERIDADYILIINADEPIERIQQQQQGELVAENYYQEGESMEEDHYQEHASVINDDEPLQVVNEPEQVQRRPRHRRSAQSRNRKNRKHNQFRRKFRFRYTIRRKVYHRFKPHLMRKILRTYQIHFTHVKMDKDYLVVGLKNHESRIEAEHNLAEDIFNSRSYFHYRKLYRH
ncbi:unnamed protein product [Rotaria sp. Silwood1]|nr:unnamed protein product [Rotaria sp. Silwood1]CAF3950162.1 unnamed protein product [Rotaria sp. Silwood1]CAF4991091.1 unnamed protein product [Rotaria sp. Silwood1]CAF5115860.1 unnamed protein product [Rotaria sp. Silwood1]